MRQRRLQRLLELHADHVGGRPGCWRFEFEGRPMIVVSDEAANRMRIMAPVAHDAFLDEFDYQLLLRANFDRTLDARYAIGGGYVWALFLHPLSDLTAPLLVEGLKQVSALASHYGDSYSVDDRQFTGCA